MHQRLTLSTLAGMLIFTTSGSQPNQTKLNNTSTVKPLTKVKITKKSTSTSTKPKVALIQNVAKLPNSVGLGLIESTDGKDRAEQVMQGRNDPFSGILTPTPVKKTPLPKKVFPVLPKLPVTKELPPPQPTPPKPKANLARRIAVEGIMQIGDKYHAIVKLPNDASSRYISEGQELLGGRLLVKRIDIDSTSGVDPTVIFEENGVEVASAVGFVPTNSKDKSIEPTETTAASPMAQITAEVAFNPSDSEQTQETATNVLPTPHIPPINKSYDQSKKTPVPPPPPDLEANTKTGDIEKTYYRSEQPTSASNNKTKQKSLMGFNALPNRLETTADSFASRNRLFSANKSSLDTQTEQPQDRYKRLIQRLRYDKNRQTFNSTASNNDLTQQSMVESNADYHNYRRMQLIERLRNSSRS